MELLDFHNVRVIKNAVVQSVEGGVATVCEMVKNYPNIANRAKLMFAVSAAGVPEMHQIPADHVIIAAGYASNDKLYFAIKSQKTHLIGDAKAPANVMEAIWSAYEVAKEI